MACSARQLCSYMRFDQYMYLLVGSIIRSVRNSGASRVVEYLQCSNSHMIHSAIHNFQTRSIKEGLDVLPAGQCSFLASRHMCPSL